MTLIELFLIAAGLSMDAFAVSVCKGLAMQKLNIRKMVIIGLWFGGFQALMPFLGWFLGSAFTSMIQNIDHWVAFILLSLIGGNMVREAVKEGDSCDVSADGADTRPGTMFLLAVATSIDALAIGITFAFLKVNIAAAVCFIGTVTFLFSVAGVAIGNRFGTRFKSKAEIAGGLILICLGIKILVEHLFFA
jgi:putative Mn2+ efflux pump MntP